MNAVVHWVIEGWILAFLAWLCLFLGALAVDAWKTRQRRHRRIPVDVDLAGLRASVVNIEQRRRRHSAGHPKRCA